jgi:hypothetical protein
MVSLIPTYQRLASVQVSLNGSPQCALVMFPNQLNDPIIDEARRITELQKEHDKMIFGDSQHSENSVASFVGEDNILPRSGGILSTFGDLSGNQQSTIPVESYDEGKNLEDQAPWENRSSQIIFPGTKVSPMQAWLSSIQKPAMPASEIVAALEK